jgi:hypothetical protein
MALEKSIQYRAQSGALTVHYRVRDSKYKHTASGGALTVHYRVRDSRYKHTQLQGVH